MQGKLFIIGLGSSIGHIGNHFAGGQAAASGADPDVEVFVFTDFKKNRRWRRLAFDQQHFYFIHRHQLISDKTGMFIVSVKRIGNIGR